MQVGIISGTYYLGVSSLDIVRDWKDSYHSCKSIQRATPAPDEDKHPDNDTSTDADIFTARSFESCPSNDSDETASDDAAIREEQ